MTDGEYSEGKLESAEVSPISRAGREDSIVMKEGTNKVDKYQNAKEYMQRTCGKGGLIIIKHGRNGKPKSRRLQCDHAVTRLYCRSDHAYKDVMINDIIAVRRGTDVDPTSSSVGPNFADDTNASSTVKNLARENAIPFIPSNGKKAVLDQGPVLFGSANLRRHCDPKDMPLCLCLVTQERTFDIQFMNKKVFDEFYQHILVLTEMNIKSDMPSYTGDRASGRSDVTVANSEEATNQTLQILEATYYDDEFSSAIDFDFLLSQGFTEREIIEMCEGLREEALLRSAKTAHIRSSINITQPVDVLKEMQSKGVVQSNASKNSDDELSEEDAAAVSAFMEQGYSEEEALQLHLQNLFVADSKKKKPVAKQVAISVQQDAEDRTISTSAVEASKGDLSV